MLNSPNLEEKTYEDLMAEAFGEIPLYTEEWTNFGPADPGVTILENFSAFTILQQNHINQITPPVQQKLLELAGFRAKKGRCARTLLSAENLNRELYIPVNHKFHLGDICYETDRPIKLEPWHLTGVYGFSGGKWHDFDFLLDHETAIVADAFGNDPAPGDCLYFVADGMPAPGQELIFYLEVPERHSRNPFEKGGNNSFAGIRWECYTSAGFEEMHVKDETACLMTSGELRMRLPQDAAAWYDETPESGYVIRARLERASYDIPPRLSSVSGFLFPVLQKDTLSICQTFNRVTNISFGSSLLQEGYIAVYCREEKGASYHRYTEAGDWSRRGRFYDVSSDDNGMYTFTFDQSKYGYGPAKVKDAVKIVVYTEEIMRRYSLGTVFGMDDQTISLPEGHVVPDSFCIIAQRIGADGEDVYDFVRPNRFGENDLTYYLHEDEGEIVIEDAGQFVGAHLYMGGFAVTKGEDGNVRAGSTFVMEEMPSVKFVNPMPGNGGCYKETADQVKSRFLKDLETPYTAVTAADYEQTVRRTPGLCIRKVKAFVNDDSNTVKIAVMPDTEEEFPALSDIYKKTIEDLLEKRRLLTTRIEVTGPVYARVNVRGSVYVRPNYEQCEEKIEEAVHRAVDSIRSDRGFGEPVRFDEVFHAIEALDCVEYVYDLSLQTPDPMFARIVNSDVIPIPNCLCYAGEIRIETVLDML